MAAPQDDMLQLTQEDADYVESLLIANEKLITVTMYNMLGENYNYLLEEAVSDLFVLTCEKVEILKKHQSPQAWLVVSAKYIALNLIKKHKKEQGFIPLDNGYDKVDGTSVFEDAVYNIWLENKVPQKLIQTLAPREREIYELLYIQNKKPKDIAKELGISVSAVNNAHKCIRDKIKKAIKEQKFLI